MNLGEMERIFGIRVKLQVIPPPGKKDPNSITKTLPLLQAPCQLQLQDQVSAA
jgi:hypothetical protein